MDGRDLDRIARALGSGSSRRSVLKGLAAGWLGLAVGSRFTSDASAGVSCGAPGEYCYPGEFECCDTFSFACLPDGEGYSCQVPACVSESEACGAPYYCCEGSDCIEGVCVTLTCAPEGYWCGEQLGCCAGLTCVFDGKGSYCEVEQCIAEGDPCGVVLASNSGSCCAGLICSSETDTCVPPPPICAPEGESCVEIECCEGWTCLEDATCGTTPEDPEDPEPPTVPDVPVVKLPDTGAGSGTSGSDWVIPAALGAAAAAVAGRKLLGERETGNENA